jgi:hypothetical protein
MTRLIGGAVLALTLMSGGSTTINLAAAASAPTAVHQSPAGQAIDLSARRRIRLFTRSAPRSHDRPYDRYYEDRPRDYAPARFTPFIFGYGLRW